MHFSFLKRLHLSGSPSWYRDESSHYAHANKRGPAKHSVKESYPKGETNWCIQHDKEEVATASDVFQVRRYKVI
jgi:hypothetical protein